MDYEKLHKDTIAKLQEMVNSGKITVEIARGICADFVPESEDEKIRKWLIGYFNQYIIDGMPQVFGNGLNVKDVIAWFEKQGEQKPTDKVEPKFHEGQWIIWQDKCYKVNYNGCGYELVDQNGLSTSLEYGTVDDNANLWDITKDAKDGDVLVSGQIIILFKNFEEDSDYNFVIAHAGIDVSGKLQITNKNWLISNEAKPATKEQREQLEKAMADAGYEWDAEKKELKKIEKTPTWNEEDERMLRYAVDFVSTSPHSYAGDIFRDEIGKDEVINWLKSLKERVQPQSQWKPSDEQMHYLSWVANIKLGGSVVEQEVSKHLNELLEDLKKLRDE